VAVASETIAKRLGYDMNAPYIAGLLHAIGKLKLDALDLVSLFDDFRMEFNDRQNLFSMLA